MDIKKLQTNLNVNEAIFGRRSVRSYAPGKVDKDTIAYLLDAAVHAPTAVYEEPWSFIVIQDEALLQRLSDRAKILVASEVKKNLSEQNKRLLAVVSNPDFNIFYDATTLIAIAVKPTSPYVSADAWLAAENLLLAAHAVGLGSCIVGFAIGVLNTAEVKQELGIPEKLSVVAPVVVGKPYGDTPLLPRKKAEILYWK